MALVENIQREDLNAIEEAEAYRALSETFSLSQEEIAARVGKGRTTITNILRLLRLPAEVQDLLRSGRLTAGQARPLLSFPDPRKQIELAEKAVREGLTARDLEALAAAPQEKAKREPTPKAEADVHTRAATERLTKVFQTQVEIQRKKKGGLIRIHFHSENELIRLFNYVQPDDGRSCSDDAEIPERRDRHGDRRLRLPVRLDAADPRLCAACGRPGSWSSSPRA